VNGCASAWRNGWPRRPKQPARFPPLRQPQRRTLTLHTVVGAVSVSVMYGRDPQSGKWHCPARVYWGLGPHQKMTPELEDRVCLTAALTGSYQAAAELTAKWGSPVDDRTIQTHARRLGQRAEQQTQQRLAAPASVPPGPAKSAVPTGIVIMMDGWMARQRGPDWGQDRTVAGADRVAWHEIKGAVIYRLAQAGQTAGGRGLITEKWTVAWQGEPLEFGRRVHAEALRRGLGSARQVFVVADGGVWIWRVQQDRFPEAQGVLDFYHASQHLWAVGQALYPGDEPMARAWVEPLLSQLRHGQEAQVLQTLTDLPAWCAARQQEVPATVARETEYFHNHREHVHYQTHEAQGCPVGSGAMESFCAQLQGRFKRCGQFWSSAGLANLLALEIARRNLDWDTLWSKN
jgi:hypothetical protein